MSGRTRKPNEELDVSEEPVSVIAWEPGDDSNPLAVIEEDIRALIRQLAEVRHSLSEQETQHRDRTRDLLLALLQVTDAFERVFRSIREKDDQLTQQMRIWVGNFRTVYRMLNNVLSEQGVSMIENLGQGFDPHWHKVADTVEDASRPDGTIVEEILNGYLWQKQVLRKTEVIVVRNT